MAKWLENLFPGWAAARAESRLKIVAARRLEATLGAGSPSRVSGTWSFSRPVAGDSLTEQYNLAGMRRRAKTADAENPIAHGILNRVVDNIIGCGFSLQMSSKSRDWNTEVQERWEAYQSDCDYRGLLRGAEFDRLAYRGVERDGGMGIVFVDRGGVLKKQLIDEDLICTPDGMSANPLIIDGVETTPGGRPVAYHVLTIDTRGQRLWTRVPASNMVYLPRLKRGATQLRGESAFATNFDLLDQLVGYVDAVVMAARMAAIFGLVIKSASPNKAVQGLAPVTGAGGEERRGMTLENGMVRYIGRQDDVVQVQASQPMTQTPEFVIALLRLIGASWDMPLELVQLNFSQTNLSSARIAMQQFYRSCEPKQDNYILTVKEPEFAKWLQIEMAMQRIKTPPPEDFAKHKFHPDAWERVDPITDMQAGLLGMSIGVDSRHRIAGMLGRPLAEIIKELGIERKALNAEGIPEVFSTYTRDLQQPGNTPQEPKDEEPADDGKQTKKGQDDEQGNGKEDPAK